MKNTICLSLAVLLFVFCISCNSQRNGEQPARQNEQQTEQTPLAMIDNIAPDVEDDNKIDSDDMHVDSFKIKMASLMKARIELPPVYQHEIVEANDEATDKFAKLSKACNGKMKILVNSGLVVRELSNTVKSVCVDQSDLLILLDRTYSMHDDIENVKIGIRQIIDSIKKYKGTRLAIAIYGDKNYDGDSWYEFHNFETHYDSAVEYLKSVQVRANGDWPESVYDAVMRSLDNKFWKSTKKCNIILVGDAPPQEKPRSDYTLEDVIAKTKSRKVRMNFYPILIMPDIKEVKLSEAEKAKYVEVKHNTKLYPNPCTGILNLSMEATATYYLELYNSAGETVWNEEFYGIIWNKDITSLPNGMYIMRVINADHTYELIKFILQH